MQQDFTPSDTVDFKTEYSESYFLSAGEANAEGKMALTHLTAKLIDIATEHANHLRIGNPYMPDDHSGWVLSRLTIDMPRYPRQDSVYSITTWVESWNRHFSERCFRIADLEGNVYGYARSVWMVLDTITHANAGLDRLSFRESFVSGEKCPIARQAKHRLIVLPEESGSSPAHSIVASEPAVEFKFRYSDLDAYRHVNTVRYVARLMDFYTLEEHDSHSISRLELSFLHECHYDSPIEILHHRISNNETGILPSQEGSNVSSCTCDTCDTFLFRDSSSPLRTPLLYARIFLNRRQ